jgi:cytochrome c oxidase assembly protein subunit 15
MLMPPMVGGIFYEHGHRMVAAFVGFLTVIQMILLYRFESRVWVKRMGLAATFLVIAQGVLGGMTVLFLLPTSISVAHAITGQSFFCLSLCIALVTSKTWFDKAESDKAVSSKSENSSIIRASSGLLVILAFFQLFLGAFMRHLGAGLAIPDFPLAFGQWFPALESLPIAIHYFHRVMAFVLLGAFLFHFFTLAKKGWLEDSFLVRLNFFLLFTFTLQLSLGALVIWTGKEIWVTSLHLAGGALILGALVIQSLWVHRFQEKDLPVFFESQPA